jgi:hypothetical protein
MNRFLNGTVTIGELEEMIVACNSASRVGVVCDPVPSFVASIKIGTSPNEIAKAPKDNDDAENDKQRIDVPSALNEIDVKMRELAKERRRLMDRQQPDLPPPPAPSDLLADLPPAYNDPNVDHD